MTTKALRTTYWVTTSLFALLLALDGLGGVFEAQAGQEALVYLGYPLYLLMLMGVAKLLAARVRTRGANVTRFIAYSCARA